MNVAIKNTIFYPGKLIVFEGIDGSGKSKLSKKIIKATDNSVLFYEPTNLRYGKLLRDKATRGESFPLLQEAFMFVKDREDNRNTNLLPNLRAGKVVCLDRYFYSSIAYQSASGMDPEEVFEINKPVLLCPDLVILLELPVEIALARIIQNRKSVSIYEKTDFLTKVAKYYKSFEAPNICRVDATLTEDEVFKTVKGIIYDEIS